MAVLQDFCIDIYAGWAINLSWKPGGVFIDLTGYSAALKIRRGPSGPIIEALSSVSGEITLGSFSNTTHQWNVEIRLPAARTTLVLPGIYSYDFLLKPPVGDPRRLLEGKITFKPGITDTI